MSVCQPGVVLALQCWLSEGFWYRSARPPVLTSTSAANLEFVNEHHGEMRERPGSAASSYRYEKSQITLPGIPTSGEDCVETRMGSFGTLASVLRPSK
jgi:hypothetical protein